MHRCLRLSGALAAVSGIMISSLSGLLPNMGGDPMMKAFVICVVAGLGNVYGAVLAAFVLGLLEASIQFALRRAIQLRHPAGARHRRADFPSDRPLWPQAGDPPMTKAKRDVLLTLGLAIVHDLRADAVLARATSSPS